MIDDPASLSPGELVRIIGGPIDGLIGQVFPVLSISPASQVDTPPCVDLDMGSGVTVCYPASALSRVSTFPVGTHVVVTKGAHRHRAGIVSGVGPTGGFRRVILDIPGSREVTVHVEALLEEPRELYDPSEDAEGIVFRCHHCAWTGPIPGAGSDWPTENLCPSCAAQEDMIAAWVYPVGQHVEVTEDDGAVTRTRTRSAPWMLCGSAVILLEGRSGGFCLSRLKPVVSDSHAEGESEDA